MPVMVVVNNTQHPMLRDHLPALAEVDIIRMADDQGGIYGAKDLYGHAIPGY